MDHAQIQRHLRRAERRVALAADHVRRQRNRVADMGSTGQPIAMAAKLLDTLESLQATYVADRDQLRARLTINSSEPNGRALLAHQGAEPDKAACENPSARDVASMLDELVEQAYSILSGCGAPGTLTEHQAINHLLRLFESGGGFEARVKAEQLLRPT